MITGRPHLNVNVIARSSIVRNGDEAICYRVQVQVSVLVPVPDCFGTLPTMECLAMTGWLGCRGGHGGPLDRRRGRRVQLSEPLLEVGADHLLHAHEHAHGLADEV